MRSSIIGVALLTFLLAACARSISAADLVVVDGLVQKGPTGPVCLVTNPCVAPVSGEFTVTRDGNTVLHFKSNADGQFRIRIAPGDYSVVPDPSVGIGNQTKGMAVAAGDSVSVTVTFDTGIY
jgi:hypothetical protein